MTHNDHGLKMGWTQRNHYKALSSIFVETTTTMKNAIVLLFLCFSWQTIVAQCGPYKHHPVWPDTVGFAYVNLSECGVDQATCLWDDGSTDLQTDLAVGPHSVTIFDGANPVDIMTFTIDQNRWDLHPNAQGTFMGVELSIFGGVEPHGPPQIFDNPDCDPVADSTVIYLLQDGVAIDSVTNVLYYAASHMWMGLPFGHTYQTHVVDHSHCGSFGLGPIITAYSSGMAEMMIDTQDAIAGNGGSIAVNDLILDPTSPLPPPTPFTGTFSLFEWPDHVPVGTEQVGTTALWEDLTPGQYNIFFTPDGLCNSTDTVVTINSISGIDEDHAIPLGLWPQPTEDFLNWSSTGTGKVRIYDPQGSLVIEGPNLGRLDVSQIPAGLYHLQTIDGMLISWARFVKQ